MTRPKCSGVANRNRAYTNRSPHQSLCKSFVSLWSLGGFPRRRKLTCASSYAVVIEGKFRCELSPSAMLFRCHFSSPSPGLPLYMGAAGAYATASQSCCRGSNPARAAIVFKSGNCPSHPDGHQSTSPPSSSPQRFLAPHTESPTGSAVPRASSLVHSLFGEKHPPSVSWNGSTKGEFVLSWPPAPMESGPLSARAIANAAELPSTKV
mmetsp:Transcript_13302/g.49746  ORF Transcript_13302/g.49746 Transcript_13302/m.49746 type:complete len:208 (-) Transcript_13302:983-1606(-)